MSTAHRSHGYAVPFIAPLTARLLAVLCSCLCPVVAASQVVRGVVVEETSGRPVPGVVVVLLDSAGKRLGGVLAGDDGSYALRAQGPGRYGIRAERIGFRADAPAKVTLGAGETVELRLVTRPIPVVLSAVHVTGRTSCVARASDGREVSAVWDEARKALYATDLTQREELFTVRASRFERTLDARTGQVKSYKATERSGATRSPFVSVPAARLSADGFVTQNASETVYYGPDAAVLLSDEFLRDHCFRLRAGEQARAGLIGLEFEPVRGRDKPDIAGTLWIDRASAELRDLEYTYRDLPNLPSSVSSERFGGRIQFRRMPTGAWIVERWVIRMPVISAVRPFARRPRAVIPGMPRTPGERVQLIAMREEGGEVLETMARGEHRASEAERASVMGVVFDSTRMAPLPGARVFLDGTQFSARSSADGSFTIDSVPAGKYSLSVVHPRFDSLAVRPPTVPVALRGAEPTMARLAVPSVATILAQDCSADELERAATALRGQVRNAANGGPAVAADVLVTWNRLEANSERVTAVAEQRLATRTDSAGRYDLCGLPDGVRLTLRATTEDWRTTPVQLTLEEHQVSVVDLVVGRPGVVASIAPRPVDAVVVRPVETRSRAMQAFDRRRRRGGGSFLVRTQIDGLHANRVTDLLRTLPGVTVRPDERGVPVVELRGSTRISVDATPAVRADTTRPAPGQNPADVVTGQASIRHCPAGYQVDGLPVDGTGGIDADLRPEDVEAIEVYSGGQVPIEYSGRHASCGLILIWTRGFAVRPDAPTPSRDGPR